MASYWHPRSLAWAFVPLWLANWTWQSDAAAIVQRRDLKALLTDPAQTWSSNTTISFPESPSFVAATERWTVFNPPTYSAAISPTTEDDVVNAVKLASSNSIPFLATGGRHSYSKLLGDVYDGLAIDLSQLDSIDIDEEAETVTVGPGVIMDDILDPLYEAGFIMQTGTAWCPSVIGVALGGGVGRFEGIYGLVIDALVSVRIVTAQGDVVEASEQCNPDLFWAIRGAGANFGVITSATFKIHRMLNQGNIFTVDFTFPGNLSSQFFQVASEMGRNLSDKLAGNAFINFDSTTNQTQTVANWMYYGTEDEGRKAMKPLFDIGGETTSYYVTWNKLMNTTSGGLVSQICIPGSIYDIYSANIKTFDAPTYDGCFDKLDAFYQKYPGGRGSAVQFDFYPNQAMKAVASDKTAWPWRDAMGFLNAGMTWAPGDNVTAQAAMALGAELRSDVASTAGYDGLSVFINYSRGDENLEQVYAAEKLSRLAQLKAQWDPDHLFSFNTGLPTKYP
ncbi:hypothetical protein F5Y15DRAFT_424979 [Xylariaceae sp. FL0016]|nr:hypothetical protein F5Y15DRAFT_424979 [Xylariaceae sp. FL0016]